MPLTSTEAQELHEAGTTFASYTAAYRVAESDRLHAQVRGEKTNPGDRYDRAIEQARAD